MPRYDGLALYLIRKINIQPFITAVILEVFYREFQRGYRETAYRLIAYFLSYKAKKCSFQQR